MLLHIKIMAMLGLSGPYFSSADKAFEKVLGGESLGSQSLLRMKLDR